MFCTLRNSQLWFWPRTSEMLVGADCHPRKAFNLTLCNQRGIERIRDVDILRYSLMKPAFVVSVSATLISTALHFLLCEISRVQFKVLRADTRDK